MGNGRMGGQQVPSERQRQAMSMNRNAMMIAYVKDVRKPSPDSIRDATNDVSRYRWPAISSALQVSALFCLLEVMSTDTYLLLVDPQPDMYPQFSKIEKMQFQEKFSNVSKNLTEMDKYLGMFLAAYFCTMLLSI